MPYISLIAAMDSNRVIGIGNKLPSWEAPGDLKRFRELTIGKAVVMGRKTYESIGKPLPKRLNFIVSSTMKPERFYWVVPSFEEAIREADRAGRAFDLKEEIMVIGGASIYRQALPVANKMYLTMVKGAYQGDVFFPEFQENDWRVSNQEDFPSHSFITYDRK